MNTRVVKVKAFVDYRVFRTDCAGVAMILIGNMLNSQVVWQQGIIRSGPQNVTIPSGDGFANGGYGSRGRIPTTRLVAVWFTSPSQPNNGIQFEVIQHVGNGDGGLQGILNSSELLNTNVLASSPSDTFTFGMADVSFSSNYNGDYFLAPVLVNTSPGPVTLTDYGISTETPSYPSAQLGGAAEFGGIAVILSAIAYLVVAVVLNLTSASRPPAPAMKDASNYSQSNVLPRESTVALFRLQTWLPGR